MDTKVIYNGKPAKVYNVDWDKRLFEMLKKSMPKGKVVLVINQRTALVQIEELEWGGDS